MTLFDRLKEERERLGLSQTKLGEMVGVVKQTVIRWEKGDASPDAPQLEKMATAGFDALYIVTGNRAKPSLVVSNPGANPRRRATDLEGGLPSTHIDENLLCNILIMLDEIIAEAGRAWTPKDKAAAVAKLYDYLRDETDVDQSKVMRTIRLVVNG